MTDVGLESRPASENSTNMTVPPRSGRMAAVDDWLATHRRLVWILIGVLGVVLLVARRPTAITRPGLYAEDGDVFLLDSLLRGAGSVFHPYNGYIHLVPRLGALAATALPIGWTPIVYVLESAVIAVAACSMVTADRLGHLIPSRGKRLWLFVMLLLIPRLTETHLALNSTLWYCGIALLLIGLSDDPNSRIGQVAELVAIPILGLTGLAGLVLAPVAVVRVMRQRSRQAWMVAGLWWATAAIQGGVYLTQSRQNGKVPIGEPLARAATDKTVGALVLGHPAVDQWWGGRLPTGLFLLMGVVGLVWLAIWINGMPPLVTAALAYTVAATIVAGFLALGPGAPLLPDRYTVLPLAALLIGLFAARPRWRPLLYACNVLLVVIVCARVFDFVVPSRPSTNWSQSEKCLAVVDQTCNIPLNPPGWTLTLAPGDR
jgi:hypothetical protein